MNEGKVSKSDITSGHANEGFSAASVAKFLFATILNTAFALSAAALAFCVVAYYTMVHGDNTVPLILSSVVAIVAGELMAWVIANRHAKLPATPQRPPDAR